MTQNKLEFETCRDCGDGDKRTTARNKERIYTICYIATMNNWIIYYRPQNGVVKHADNRGGKIIPPAARTLAQAKTIAIRHDSAMSEARL